MVKNYIGITVGPIFRTIQQADKPITLWFASAAFSDLTRRLCIGIQEAFPDAVIYSPYFREKKIMADSVGKYHDRILFSTEQFDRQKLENIIAAAKREMIRIFPKEMQSRQEYEQFLMQYLQISYTVLDAQQMTGANCGSVLNPMLDALELMPGFPPDNRYDLFRHLFRGGNKSLRGSALFNNIRQNRQYVKPDGSIRSIEDICSFSHTGKAPDKYYALVYGDGDRVGKLLNSLSDAGQTDSLTETEQFSKACLDYNKAASRMVGEYGGMTIFAGGDDLQFLAPLTGKIRRGDQVQDGSIFELCAEIKNCFLKCLQDNIDEEKIPNSAMLRPAVSFGIAIRYRKFPLYEALNTAHSLLYEAKGSSHNSRDRMAVDVQKHSGQSIFFYVPNEFASEPGQLQAALDKVTQLKALPYTLENFHVLFDHMIQNSALSEEDFIKIGQNLFDNDNQEQYKDAIRSMLRFLYTRLVQRGTDRKIAAQDDGQKAGKLNDVDTMIRLLRYLMFLRGEEKDSEKEVAE